MKTAIETGIKALITLGTKEGVKSDEALRYTQAALNLAHVAGTLEAAKMLPAGSSATP